MSLHKKSPVARAFEASFGLTRVDVGGVEDSCITDTAAAGSYSSRNSVTYRAGSVPSKFSVNTTVQELAV